MKLAFIPPISLRDYTFRTNYQLMLPQLIESDEYTLTYKRHCNTSGTFVILDNGEAEGVTTEPKKLIDIAFDFGVNEVVIPDTIGDSKETIDKAVDFYHQLTLHETQSSDKIRFGPDFPFSFMFVLQGKTYDEYLRCADWAIKQPWIKTLSVPRHTLETLGDIQARIRLTNNIIDRGWITNQQFHFLGGSHLWSHEGRYLAAPNTLNQYYIRGMDTSMPFNYAYAKKFVNSHGVQVKRPEGYFDLPAEDFEGPFLQENVNVMMEWCDLYMGRDGK